MGRSRDSTLQARSRGRRLMMRRRSAPSTRASRSRNVKIGRRSSGLRERISGHIPMMRRSSMALNSMERRKSTVDLRSESGTAMMGGYSATTEKKSMLIESRNSIFSSNSLFWLGGRCVEDGSLGISVVVDLGLCGRKTVVVVVVVALEESERKWMVLGR